MPDQFLESMGLKIRYRSSSVPATSTQSAKHTVILFHGLSFSLENWYEIGTVETLTKNGYQVHAIDLPRGLKSKSDKVDYDSFSEYVPILEGIFSKLGVASSTGPLVIVGPSMGGGLALAYSMAHPQAIKGLVLVSPALRSIDEERLNVIKAPVLLVYGENDDVFSLEQYGLPLKAKIENCRIVTLENAGHAAYLDKPKEFNEALLSYLDSI